MGKKKFRVNPKMTILGAIMLFASFVSLFPILYAILSSFKTKVEMGDVLALPSSLYLENYQVAWERSDFPALLTNSLFVTVLSMSIILVIGSLAAYPISRNSGKLYVFLYLFFLSGMMVPFQSGMIPLYGLIRNLGLMNTRLSLVLVAVNASIPITILIFTGFIKTIPRELEEAAKIDGCGYMKTLFRIVFPLLVPATVSVIILNILPIWNDFMSPLLFISRAELRTLPVGIYMFIGDRSSDFGPIFAISTLTLIIPVALFLSLQKYFYKGITAGAVKG
ncbi:MAG: carbohydrate ABC transporter permease [Oscillospiraceae bacterium]|nr:carbohydrate ABC transporter permease [Oscillospiraceae bacterium]